MNFKKYLPHLITIVVFAALTLLYFSPLMDGKVLRQSDIMNWKGMSQEITEFRNKFHEEPLWTNSMFGGMPAYQISVEYHGNKIVQIIDKIVRLGLPEPAGTVFLYLIGFYFLLITLRIDRRVAILGAIAFAFSSYSFIIIEVGHNSKANAIGYMALVVAGIIMMYRSKLWQGAAITALALALEILSNHPQIAYYLAMTIAILIVVEFINAVKKKTLPRFVKASALLALVGILAVGTNIAILLGTAEYGKYSTRGPSELTGDKENQTKGLDRDYITQWSYGIGESFTLLVPDFKGGASESIARNREAMQTVDSKYREYLNQLPYSTYFGDQPFTAGPTYAGAIVCLLFFIGLFIIKGDLKWWIVSASLLALMLSWGKYFMGLTNLFLDYLPGYDKFRTVSMILVVVTFLVPLMAALALDRLIKNSGFIEQNKKKIYYGMGIIIGLSLLMLIAPTMFTSFDSAGDQRINDYLTSQKAPADFVDGITSAVESARKSIFTADVLRTFFFVLVAGALIAAFMRFKFKPEYLVYSLIALVLMDMWTVDKRYLNSDDFVRKSAAAVPFPFTNADAFIKQDTTQSYRVLNVSVDAFQDASVSYYHQSIGGYHGAKLKRYKELIDSSLSMETQNLRMMLQGGTDSTVIPALRSLPAINMMNTKYIIYNPDAPPVYNPYALGNAWFVQDIHWVPNADAEISAINSLSPGTTAVIDERFKEILNGFQPAYDSSASITMNSYRPNHLIYQSHATSDQLAVFSEIYYDKGWNVYVDGKRMPYVRADYVLRAMKIPAGDHTVEWKFEPATHYLGEKISLASSIILMLFVGAIAFKEWRQRKQSA